MKSLSHVSAKSWKPPFRISGSSDASMARAGSALTGRATLRWPPWFWFCLRLFSLLFPQSCLSSSAPPPLSLMGVALQEQILINLHHGCSGSTFCSLHLSITFRLLWFIFNQTISLLGATEACLTRLSCHCEVLQTEFKPFCCNMYQSLSSSCVYTASSKMGP